MIDAAAGAKATRAIARALEGLNPETRAWVLSAFGVSDPHEAWKMVERQRKALASGTAPERPPEANGGVSGSASGSRAQAR